MHLINVVKSQRVLFYNHHITALCSERNSIVIHKAEAKQIIEASIVSTLKGRNVIKVRKDSFISLSLLT